MREFKKYFFEGLLQLTILAALMRQQNVILPPGSGQFFDYFNLYPNEPSYGLLRNVINANVSNNNSNFSSFLDLNNTFLYKFDSGGGGTAGLLNDSLSSSAASSRLSEELRQLNRLNARLNNAHQQHSIASNSFIQPPAQHYIVAPSYFYLNNNNNPKDMTSNRSETRLLLNSLEFNNNNQLTKEVICTTTLHTTNNPHYTTTAKKKI